MDNETSEEPVKTNYNSVNKSRALQFIPAPTSPWLVRKHFLLANKSMLLARLIKIPIRTIQLQYVFICT